MEKITFKAVYNRKGKLLKDGTSLVQIEAYQLGQKKYFSTKIYIKPEQWDKKNRRVKNHYNQHGLNRQIRDFIDRLESAELRQRQNSGGVNLEHLLVYVKGDIKEAVSDFIRQQISDTGNKTSTAMNNKRTADLLDEFRPGLLFSRLDYETVIGFGNYLKKKGLAPNTVTKNISILRAFTNRAIDVGLMELSNYPFRKVKTAMREGERVHLTPEEIEKMKGVKIPETDKDTEQAKDMYMFSICTGIRYSDVIRITPKNIEFRGDGEWLVFKQAKTERPVNMPFYMMHGGLAVDIVFKYIAGRGAQDAIFDYMSNAKINKCLEKVANLAGIDKKITFHTARHTMATYALYKGVSLAAVQVILGHSNIKTTQIYAKVMDMTLVNELTNAFGAASGLNPR